MKQTLAFVGLGIVILLGVWFFLAQKSRIDTGDEAVVPKMQSYDSNLYKVAFTYPDTYKLEERDLSINNKEGHFITLTKKDEQVPQNGEGGTSISVIVFENKQKKELTLFLRELQNLHVEPTSGWDYQETTINNREALAYSSSGLYESDNVALMVGGNVYILSVSWLTREDQILKDFNTLLQSVSLSE